MKDPYEVLGVSPRATDEEIKKAYRALVKKYHPDNYHNNPLSDLAQEKMKEINEAYEQINAARSGSSSGTRQRAASNGFGGGYDQQYANPNSGGGQSGNATYYRIRQEINRGNYETAEQLLNGISNRDAQWHFLSGAIAQRRGWLDEAYRNYQLACSMDPMNQEYRFAMQSMQNGGSPYRQSNYNTGCTACDVCNTLICMNLFCDCMGGC